MHHDCGNGEEESTASKLFYVCSSSSLFYSLLRFFSATIFLFTFSVVEFLFTTHADDPGKRDHSHTHPHTHVSQAPTHVSHLWTDRLRTTESPAARVTRFKYRNFHHAALSAVDSSSLSSTSTSPWRRRRHCRRRLRSTGRSSSGRRKRQSSSHVAADKWGKQRNDSRDDSVASATTNADVRRRARSPRRSRMTFPIRGYSRRADIQRNPCLTPAARWDSHAGGLNKTRDLSSLSLAEYPLSFTFFKLN